MRSKILFVLLILCVGPSATAAHLDPNLEKFKSLAGPEQVAVVFQERFHGRSRLFWKRSSERWLTAADARLSFEQEILVASDDPGINSTLATEIMGHDVARATRYSCSPCVRASSLIRTS